jgi:hypothetical protein
LWFLVKCLCDNPAIALSSIDGQKTAKVAINSSFDIFVQQRPYPPQIWSGTALEGADTTDLEVHVKRRELLLASASLVELMIPGVTSGASSSAQNTIPARIYTTNFPLVEKPISEGGVWHHLDPTLTVVSTEVLGGVHVAHGTQTGSGGYDDSNAYLSGFPENQSVQGTIWMSPSILSSPNREVELLLRWRDDNPPRRTRYGTTSVTGYEININQNGQYLQLGTFKGPLLASAASPPVPKTGDIFKAQIITNANGSATIIVYWNGVEKINYTHSTPVTGGNPGIGFYIDSGARNDEFGFSSVTASGEALPTLSPPTNPRVAP